MCPLLQKGIRMSYRSYDNISPSVMEGLTNYRDHKILPGSFLQACLANDFMDAACRVSAQDVHSLPAIALWIRNELHPSSCWGSREAINDWIKDGRLDGI